MRLNGIATAALLLAACGQPSQQAPVANNAVAPDAPKPPRAPSPPANVQAPLAEPKGAIDPKSVEAAGQVVQHYGARIEQKRFAEAERLWGDAGGAAQFTLQLRRYPDIRLEIGDLGEPEGAAGSIYVTESVVFYGKDANAKAFRRAADVILRRVNDVPGSTAAQRRWHIERIEWKDAG